MAHPLRTMTPTPRAPPPGLDDLSPLGKIEGLDQGDFREAAYEVFFTACRASPGFGGRSAITYYNTSFEEGHGDAFGSPRSPGVGMAVTSRVKRALGLKMLRRSTSRRSNSCGSNPSSPGNGNSMGSPRASGSPSVKRRPMTSAEIMRHQMWVTEQSDNRLRKTLMRTLVGQMGRRAETIILPLELLRHLKPSEFADAEEYHHWQKRQLRVLEVGLLDFPSIPLDKSDPSAEKLRAIIKSAEGKPIDTGKNSETMRALCSSVVALAWRSADGGATDVCHWADGYPLNAEIYKALLQSIFDIKDPRLVLDEVDELLELIKKTWSTLGINKPIHNLCFTWVLFEQYVATAQTEPDLLAASLTMLTEVANDAKKADREPTYMIMLASLLTAMKKWCEMRLLDYHSNFNVGSIELMESILPLVFSATKILEEDVPSYINLNITQHQDKGDTDYDYDYDSSGNKVDHYIRSSSRNAFAMMVEEHNGADMERERVSEMIIKLARETEQVAAKEKDIFSPAMKKWHPIAAGVSAVTLHTCYGALLRQYLSSASAQMNETILVLQRAGKLEKALVQMVVEDSVECEDGGKAVVREMVPYEVDTIILKLFKQWMQEKLKIGKDKLQRAKETETWNPKSKSEPYAHSAEEIIKFCKETIDNFFEIPINVSESLVYDLSDSLEHLLGDYITFVASCGSKQSYLPTLPPLTRCSKDSKFVKLWKKAACSVGTEQQEANQSTAAEEGKQPRPSTSRGTQRLYIRLNTLHYLVKHLHSLDKTLSLCPKVTPSKSRRLGSRRQSYFEQSRSAIQAACQHVAEVAAYRLTFLDSSSVLYANLYNPDVASTRIKPALRILKQNLTLLCAIVTDHVQALALRHVMSACFEAYLMVLLAGGSSRIFYRPEHAMIEEDFEDLRRLFSTCSEGLIGEEEVGVEAEALEGVVALMGQTTEQLVEDFSILVSGVGAGQKLPLPPTTGKWSRSDPNTILRVLCHRNDRAANSFLKRTFHLAKRPGSL